MNLASVILEHAERQPEKPAVLYRERCIDYRELAAIVESVAAQLHASGIRPGDRVGLSMAEHPLHLAAHFGVAHLNAVIVPMDHRWTDTEVSAAARTFDAQCVVTDDRAIAGVRCLSLDERGASSGALPPAAGGADLLISLSSGTTGKPKGAIVTHENLYERFVSQWRTIGYGADDCFVVLTPFYFGAGRSFGMSLLAAGGTVRIAPPPMKPEEVLEVLRDRDVTATFVPPTMLRRLFELHRPGSPPLLEHVSYLVVSGEPLYADEARRCLRDVCPNLYSYYASSEGGGISVLTPRDAAEFAATVGKPSYGTDVEIVDEDGRRVADGVVGRLRYRGPGVAIRYVDGDGIEREAGSSGWFYPGDLAERLPSGHIALHGRDKDVIIRGGVNIYPAEIEAVLLTVDGVSEAAVVGIDDPERGQVVRAFIAGDVPVDMLEAHCREHLAPYKIPQSYRFVDALPKRTSGKVDKKALVSAR